MLPPDQTSDIHTLKGLLDPYDPCQLECDGLTSALHTVLLIHRIPHQVYCGSVHDPVQTAQVNPHYWIQTATERVDYRLRMWLGNLAHVPHGILSLDLPTEVQYVGHQIDLPPLSPTVFTTLTGLPYPQYDQLPR